MTIQFYIKQDLQHVTNVLNIDIYDENNELYTWRIKTFDAYDFKKAFRCWNAFIKNQLTINY